VRLRFARSAGRHRVPKASIRHVTEHCGLLFEQSPPPAGRAQRETRLVFLGDGPDGEPLEVMAVELSGRELLVIHAMPLRERYRDQYEEARKWRS
jgi:hypothetical protein